MSRAGLFAFLYYLLMSIFATICTAFWSLHRSKLSSSQSLSHFQWIANSYQLAIWLKRGMFWNQVHKKSSPSPNHHSQNQNKSSIMIYDCREDPLDAMVWFKFTITLLWKLNTGFKKICKTLRCCDKASDDLRGCYQPSQSPLWSQVNFFIIEIQICKQRQITLAN